jgi:hypothetical protein
MNTTYLLTRRVAQTLATLAKHQRHFIPRSNPFRAGPAAICGLILAAAGYPAATYAQLPPLSSDTYVEGFDAATGGGAVINPPGGAASPGTANFAANVTTTEGQAVATTSYGSATAGPSVAATAESYVGSFTAYASLTYYFEVVGPGQVNSSPGTTNVDLSAFANAITNPGTTGASSEASVGISEVSPFQSLVNGEVLVTCVVGSCPPNPGAYLSPTSLTVQENEQYQVNLVVQAVAGTSNSSSENILSAVADPQIYLNPSDAPGLSLLFSDGINEPPGLVSTAPVPLPSTWLMLLSSFVGFGMLSQRRTKRGSAATAAV